MQLRISSPKHYESRYGSSDVVRAYLDQIEKSIGESLSPELLEILRISLLIASPEELAQGKFLAYESFDWRCGYAAVGVNGNFERYHFGDDLDQVSEISEMLQSAFIKVAKKRKSQFNANLANEIVIKDTRAFMEHYSKSE